MGNLVKIYLHDAAMPDYHTLLLYGGTPAFSTPHAQSLLQQAEAFITTYAKYITGLYMIGLLLHAFKLMGGFVHIHNIRRQKSLSQNGLWSAKAAELAKKLKMVKAVSLYFSEHIQIPLTIGHLKPIIIFPIALINNLDTDQVEAILLHELAHIQRNDYLLNILQCIMETILCFNPFVWLISKTIRQEREYCCDDMVIDEECSNFTYSKALLIIAQQNHQNYALAMASTGANKYPLLNRIKRLNTMKTPDSLPKFHLLIIVAVASIGALLAWGIPQYSVAKTTHAKHVKAIAAPAARVAAPAPLSYLTEKPAVPPASKPGKATVYTDTVTDKRLNDTINRGKSKFKIVLEDDKGNKKEYNSVEDMPDSARDEFIKENPSYGAFKFNFKDSLKFASMDKFKMGPEFEKQMLALKIAGEQMRKKFNSPEWRKQMADMKVQMKKQFDNPEWKKQMEDMQLDMKKQFDNPEWKKQMEDMQEQMKKQFDSPEWKKQMADMKIEAEKVKMQFNSPEWKKQMADMKKQGEDMKKKFNSPEWKKKMRDMKKRVEKMQNSPEWKKQQKDMEKEMKDEQDKNKNKADADSVKTSN